MANCQNHMRYGNQTNMYQRYNNRCAGEYYTPERRQGECCRETRMPEQRETECCRETRMPERRETECCRETRMPERRETECCREVRMPEQRNRKCCKNEFPGMPIAMAYVPWQEWCEIYDICEGFSRGTIFRELDKPFQGRGGCNR